MFKRMLSAGIAALGVVIVAVIATTSAEESQDRKKYACCSPENREAIMQAVENKDYDAWKTLVSENGNGSKMLDHINEDNFGRFSEMHGYMSKAKDIREELGLPNKRMGKAGFTKKGMPRDGFAETENAEKFAEIRDLMKEGKIDEAKAIADELGLKGGRMGMMKPEFSQWKGCNK